MGNPLGNEQKRNIWPLAFDPGRLGRLLESLQDVFEATFPTISAHDVIEGHIKRSKLCARYLKDHAGIELEWTTHLPDHQSRLGQRREEIVHLRTGFASRNRQRLRRSYRGWPGCVSGKVRNSTEYLTYPTASKLPLEVSSHINKLAEAPSKKNS